MIKSNNNSNFCWPNRHSNNNPIWIAAHSPISKFDINRTVQLFEKYEAAGVALLVTGEIILDCMDETMNGPVIRLKGSRDNEKNPVGFHLLGPAEPNLLPATVGIDLCKAAVKASKLPIVANIGFFGLAASKNLVDNLKKLIDTGISAFEIALSCPTLMHQAHRATWWAENFQFIEEIRKYSSLPIALKIGYQNLKDIDFRVLFKFCDWYDVTQLTAIDGIKLACPPKINSDGSVQLPFSNYSALCHVGAHGPWNKFLLYDSVALLKKARDLYSKNNIMISATGGLMSVENVFEAMALGADNVQLSSTLFWNGIDSAKNIISQTRNKLPTFNESMEKTSFSIDDHVKEGLERSYSKEYLSKWNDISNVSSTDLAKCISCGLCCNTPCLAREFKAKLPAVVENLCSGCGWCKEICPVDAIHMKQK